MSVHALCPVCFTPQTRKEPYLEPTRCSGCGFVYVPDWTHESQIPFRYKQIFATRHALLFEAIKSVNYEYVTASENLHIIKQGDVIKARLITLPSTNGYLMLVSNEESLRRDGQKMSGTLTTVYQEQRYDLLQLEGVLRLVLEG